MTGEKRQDGSIQDRWEESGKDAFAPVDTPAAIPYPITDEWLAEHADDDEGKRESA